MEQLLKRHFELERDLRNLALPEIAPLIGCHVLQSSSQSIPATFWTVLSFQVEVYDSGECWSPSNSTRLYVPVGGYYVVGGSWAPASFIRGYRYIVAVRQNGTTYITYGSNETVCYLNAGDYVEILAYHDVSSAVSTSASSTHYYTHAWLHLIS